jgi:uncharacterized iron-regulated membrane protein
MRTITIRRWAVVHKWTSLVCTAFLLMLCLTGLPLIFHEEIDGLTSEKVSLATLPPATPMLSLDTILKRALAAAPSGEVPLYMSFDTDRPVVNVTTGPTPDADVKAMRFFSLDHRTGAVLAPEPTGGVVNFMLRLHTDMFLGLPGMLFLGFVGFLFVVAIVSGVVLYAPFMARLSFGEIRRTKRTRARWTDYHNLLGVTTMLWASVVGLTGIINTLVTPLTNIWKADQLAAMVLPYARQPVPRRLSSIQAAVDNAVRAVPDTQPDFIAFPGVAYSSSHHFAVFLQGATPLTRKLLTPALIDAQTGILTSARPMPWYMQGLLLSQPLHFGDYGGMAMKLLWALLDLVTIMVLGSGLYLWLAKRGVRGA